MLWGLFGKKLVQSRREQKRAEQSRREQKLVQCRKEQKRAEQTKNKSKAKAEQSIAWQS